VEEILGARACYVREKRQLQVEFRCRLKGFQPTYYYSEDEIQAWNKGGDVARAQLKAWIQKHGDPALTAPVFCAPRPDTWIDVETKEVDLSGPRIARPAKKRASSADVAGGGKRPKVRAAVASKPSKEAINLESPPHGSKAEGDE